MEKEIRILVADDHPVVRQGLVAMLRTEPDFVVVAEASTGKEALQQVEVLAPDIILLDLEMPEMDGVEVIRSLREIDPDTRILVFTAYDTDEKIVNAVEAGAQGYLLKGAERQKVFEAVRVICDGGSLLQPVVATKLMQHMSGQGDKSTDRVESLTNRESEVIQLLSKGFTNKEIARELVITERTVKFHVSSILGKLGAGNRTEAVSIAAQRGLVDL